MSLQWFFERFDQFDSREAIVIGNRSLTYEGLKTAPVAPDQGQCSNK